MGGLGPLSGPMWAVLGPCGRFRSLYGRSWVALGASVGGLGPLSGPSGGYLRGPWGGVSKRVVLIHLFGCHLGSLLAGSWACMGGLGRSRGLCWRYCAALGAYVGGLGPLLGPM